MSEEMAEYNPEGALQTCLRTQELLGRYRAAIERLRFDRRGKREWWWQKSVDGGRDGA